MGLDTKTYWLTVSRNVTLTSVSWKLEEQIVTRSGEFKFREVKSDWTSSWVTSYEWIRGAKGREQRLRTRRRQTSQVAPCVRVYFWVIVINLSNKSLHLNRNPLISCRVTRIHDNNFPFVFVMHSYSQMCQKVRLRVMGCQTNDSSVHNWKLVTCSMNP
jgi:hypothetical protein